MSRNTNECGFHNPIGKKIEKPETLLCRVRFSLTITPVFQAILLKKIRAKFLRRTKHYPIATGDRKSNFLYFSSLHICPRRCHYCLTHFFLQKFSAKNSAMTELSSLGLERNRTFFNEQFRLHSIDRNYLKSAIND